MIVSPVDLYEHLSPSSEVRVQCQCDQCGRTTSTTYANYTRAQRKRGNDGVTQCRVCATKGTGLKRRGTPAWNKGIENLKIQRENSPKWKGGRYLDSDGYWNVYTKFRTYQKEHRFIMEMSIGRKLFKSEFIHHIDLDKKNNDLRNLFLCPDEQKHRDIHMELQFIAVMLMTKGLVGFDPAEGHYSMTKELLHFMENRNEN